MPIFRPRIAIVGGGPSGLALGQLLQEGGIHATIYELRGKFTQEELAKPSGMLDLHEEYGLTVMRECGLLDSFQVAVGDCSESIRVINPNSAVLHTDEGELASRPEIARNTLTSLLIQNVPSDIIKWNHKITTARSSRNATTTGATEIKLGLEANGATTYDFVVGADGAWSQIRKLLSDVQPFYSGEQWVTATVRHVSTKYPHLVELNGSGTVYALGGGGAIMTHRGPQDSIRVYAAVSTPHEHWPVAAGLEGKTAAEVKTTLLGDDMLFRKWAPAL
jgi:2-polyprenyl-6-methoxyphenol hydroxylase-like FAD-dependent oxidoreductase